MCGKRVPAIKFVNIKDMKPLHMAARSDVCEVIIVNIFSLISTGPIGIPVELPLGKD